MGLFNRNKGDASAPSTLGAATPPADNSTFDFDAISRDLDAQNGASSFDSLLAAPVSNAQQVPEGSTVDFPENDPLGLSTPTVENSPVTAPLATSPEAVLNAPLHPSTPGAGVAPLENSPRATSTVATEVPKAKKSLPLVPLLGALGLLAVAGAGAMILLNSNQEPEPVAPATPPAAIVGNDNPGSPGGPIVPPTRATAPVAPDGAPAPLPPQVGLRSASPGIAPPPAAKKPIQIPRGKSNVSIIVGQRATNGAPSATGGLDPALASRLKALWQAGADAKHRRDYKGARDAWGQALTLRPNHPGFRDAINKLPR